MRSSGMRCLYRKRRFSFSRQLPVRLTLIPDGGGMVCRIRIKRAGGRGRPHRVCRQGAAQSADG